MQRYFLAANSFEGFISLFPDFYDARDGWKVYIIKGGPGCGKSSFMRSLAETADENGIVSEICPCSSDPASLDAVIFPSLKTAFIDGTAPHTVEPKYPGVCENILNFGEFWDASVLAGHKEEIIAAADKNKALHKTAAIYLDAAGKLLRDEIRTAEYCTDKRKLKVFSERLAAKYLGKAGDGGGEKVRFSYGVTPKGVVSFANEMTASVSKTVIIKDGIGFAANEIISLIRKKALNGGYGVISVRDAFLPSLYCGIIVPELSFAIMREDKYNSFDTDSRRIRSERFCDAGLLKKSRRRLKSDRKMINELLDSAVLTLSDAKKVHDELEGYYIGTMNFSQISKLFERLFDKILTNNRELKPKF